MFKTKKLLVRRTIVGLVQKYQHVLNQKADLIDADLDSKEKLYISKMKENPKIWDTESLHFNLNTNYNQDFSTAVGLEVTITQVGF